METCIQYIHHICCHCGSIRCWNYSILLQEVSTHHIASGILHQDIATKLVLANSTCCERILTMSSVHSHSIDIDLRLLSCIDCCHHDVGIETLARIKSCLLGNNKGVKLVDSYIFHVDIGNQGMQHFTLGITNIALQLRQQSNGCCHGHILKHVLLPVLAQILCILRHTGRKIALDDFLLMLIGDHHQYTITIAVDGTI